MKICPTATTFPGFLGDLALSMMCIAFSRKPVVRSTAKLVRSSPSPQPARAELHTTTAEHRSFQPLQRSVSRSRSRSTSPRRLQSRSGSRSMPYASDVQPRSRWRSRSRSGSPQPSYPRSRSPPPRPVSMSVSRSTSRSRSRSRSRSTAQDHNMAYAEGKPSVNEQSRGRWKPLSQATAYTPPERDVGTTRLILEVCIVLSGADLTTCQVTNG